MKKAKAKEEDRKKKEEEELAQIEADENPNPEQILNRMQEQLSQDVSKADDGEENLKRPQEEHPEIKEELEKLQATKVER